MAAKKSVDLDSDRVGGKIRGFGIRNNTTRLSLMALHQLVIIKYVHNSLQLTRYAKNTCTGMVNRDGH